MNGVFVAGVGIHPFGRFPATVSQLGAAAAQAAVADASVGMDEVDMTFVANVGGDMSTGQMMIGEFSAAGGPVITVEAACASSGSALRLGWELIRSGAAEVVLCVGAEKAPRGFIANGGFEPWQIAGGLGVHPIYFGIWADELLRETDATAEDLAQVSVKNHRHGALNPNAMFRDEVTVEQVLASRMVCPPLTLLELCAPNEGAAAAVLTSEAVARRNGRPLVELKAVSIVSRGATDWFSPSVAGPIGATRPSARAARLAYETAGIGPEDLDLVECQDTDSASELYAYRDLGLCAAGDEAKLLRSGATALGGRLPVNSSGGLLSKGEPLGASGLGQLHELVVQLRGEAGERQVDRARVGAGQVIGAGYNASVMVVAAAGGAR